MISKASSLSHTKASIKYGWNQEKDAEIVFNQHLVGENPGDISKEFAMVQRLNTVCVNNTISIVISPCIDDRDKLNKKMLSNICQRFISKLGMEDHQAIAFSHHDRAHLHSHLYLNRINFRGKAYNDSFIGKKCQRIAKEIAEELNLTTVEKIQERKMEATKSIRQEIFKNHQAVLKQKPSSIDEYLMLLRDKGVDVVPITNKSKQLQGFRYKFKNSDFRGSEVNRKLIGYKIINELSRFSKVIKDYKVMIGSESYSLHPNLKKGLDQDRGNDRNLNR